MKVRVPRIPVLLKPAERQAVAQPLRAAVIRLRQGGAAADCYTAWSVCAAACCAAIELSRAEILTHHFGLLCSIRDLLLIVRVRYEGVDDVPPAAPILAVALDDLLWTYTVQLQFAFASELGWALRVVAAPTYMVKAGFVDRSAA